MMKARRVLAHVGRIQVSRSVLVAVALAAAGATAQTWVGGEGDWPHTNMWSTHAVPRYWNRAYFSGSNTVHFPQAGYVYPDTNTLGNPKLGYVTVQSGRTLFDLDGNTIDAPNSTYRLRVESEEAGKVAEAVLRNGLSLSSWCIETRGLGPDSISAMVTLESDFIGTATVTLGANGTSGTRGYIFGDRVDTTPTLSVEGPSNNWWIVGDNTRRLISFSSSRSVLEGGFDVSGEGTQLIGRGNVYGAATIKVVDSGTLVLTNILRVLGPGTNLLISSGGKVYASNSSSGAPVHPLEIGGNSQNANVYGDRAVCVIEGSNSVFATLPGWSGAADGLSIGYGSGGTHGTNCLLLVRDGGKVDLWASAHNRYYGSNQVVVTDSGSEFVTKPGGYFDVVEGFEIRRENGARIAFTGIRCNLSASTLYTDLTGDFVFSNGVKMVQDACLSFKVDTADTVPMRFYGNIGGTYETLVSMISEEGSNNVFRVDALGLQRKGGAKNVVLLDCQNWVVPAWRQKDVVLTLDPASRPEGMSWRWETYRADGATRDSARLLLDVPPPGGTVVTIR